MTLGTVIFEGKKYEIVTIVRHPDGDQKVTLKEIYSSKQTVMFISK